MGVLNERTGLLDCGLVRLLSMFLPIAESGFLPERILRHGSELRLPPPPTPPCKTRLEMDCKEFRITQRLEVDVSFQIVLTSQD